MSQSPLRIVFLDCTAPKPFDPDVLRAEPLGGTEASVVRIAEGLGKRGHEVFVGQKVRTQWNALGYATYLPFDEALKTTRPDAVIGLRAAGLLPLMKAQWPDARRFAWLQDFNQREFIGSYDKIKGSNTRLVCVSRTQMSHFKSEMLTQIGFPVGLTLDFVYNPVDEDLQPDATPVDRHKLVFFSSPHKGLDHAVSLFQRLREFDPDFRLHIANPGYLPDSKHSDSGVVQLGSLPHAEVIKHVRSALAVWHPNWVFPETFGIVHSEAAAVGTPVLTTMLGANREIISDTRFTLSTRDPKDWIDTILKWRDERPTNKVREEFRLSNVVTDWERVLNGSS